MLRKLKLALTITVGLHGWALAHAIVDEQYEMAALVGATGAVLVAILWSIRAR